MRRGVCLLALDFLPPIRTSDLGGTDVPPVAFGLRWLAAWQISVFYPRILIFRSFGN